MKWNSKRDGEIRVIKKYAWLPIRIKNYWGDPKIEWRWLEMVKIEQEYKVPNINSSVLQEIKGYFFGGYWINRKFFEFGISDKRDKKLRKLGI